MARLLDLPPELLSSILALACPPSLEASPAAQLSVVCRALHFIALPLVWRTLCLPSSHSIACVLASTQLRSCARHIRRVAFLPLNTEGGARGGVGRGIGTSETVDGKAVGMLLERLKELWKEEQAEEEQRGGGVTSLDVASVDGLRADVLQGAWLSELCDLTLGPNLLLPTNRPLAPLHFSFRLRSLTLHNNHWQSLPAEVLADVLRAALPLDPSDAEDGLQHLDLSATYDVTSSGPFLQRLTRSTGTKGTGEGDGEARGSSVLETVTSLVLPVFETAAHLDFAVSALSLCCAPPSASPFAPPGWHADDADPPGDPRTGRIRQRQRLRYLELPALSSPSSAQYDALWAVLELLSHGTAPLGEPPEATEGIEEIGLRGWVGPHFPDTVAALFAAVGVRRDDGLVGVSARRAGLRRLRLVGVRDPDDVPRQGADFISHVQMCGVEVVFGPRRPAVQL